MRGGGGGSLPPALFALSTLPPCHPAVGRSIPLLLSVGPRWGLDGREESGRQNDTVMWYTLPNNNPPPNPPPTVGRVGGAGDRPSPRGPQWPSTSPDTVGSSRPLSFPSTINHTPNPIKQYSTKNHENGKDQKFKQNHLKMKAPETHSSIIIFFCRSPTITQSACQPKWELLSYVPPCRLLIPHRPGGPRPPTMMRGMKWWWLVGRGDGSGTALNQSPPHPHGGPISWYPTGFDTGAVVNGSGRPGGPPE